MYTVYYKALTTSLYMLSLTYKMYMKYRKTQSAPGDKVRNLFLYLQ